ncbi:MAG: C40 family peptidase [Lachnospiraceae bacterium]|nr:C40 family peptidase [Lachnospiraceae bacterium]
MFKNGHGQKRILILFLIAAVLTCSAAGTIDAWATTVESLQSEIDSLDSEIDDLEKQKKEAEEEKNEAQSGLSGTNSKISSISGAMGDLDAEIEGVDQELIGLLTAIDMIQADIENKITQIAQTQTEYDEAVKLRDEQYESMKIRIRYMYEQGDATYISIFIEAASSLADALNKAEYVEQLYEYDRLMLEQYMATVQYTKEVWDRLEEEKSELETSKIELEEEQKYLEELEAELQAEYENYGVMLAQAKQQAAIFTARINQQTNEIRDLEQKEAEKRKEAEAKKKEKEAEEQRLREEAEAAAAAAAAAENGESTDTSTETTSYTEDTGSTSSSSSGGTTVTASGSGTGAQIANYALQFVGNPYVAGGTDPVNGADCSGFVQAVYRAFGISLPRTSYAQSTVGTAVSYSEARAGDILYYGGHVGIYIGNGQIVHASTQRTGIKISPATYRSIITIRRVVN